LEEYLDDAVSGNGLSFYVFDVVDSRGQDTLERRHDATRHLVWRQPRVLPYDTDDRNPDVRKDVRGRAKRGKRSDNENKYSQNNECIWPLESNANNTNHKNSRVANPAAIRRATLRIDFYS
jgi:hypothetical protein